MNAFLWMAAGALALAFVYGGIVLFLCWLDDREEKLKSDFSYKVSGQRTEVIWEMAGLRNELESKIDGLNRTFGELSKHDWNEVNARLKYLAEAFEQRLMSVARRHESERDRMMHEITDQFSMMDKMLVGFGQRLAEQAWEHDRGMHCLARRLDMADAKLRKRIAELEKQAQPEEKAEGDA